MNVPRPPDDPAPLETNDTVTVLAGTGLWVIALVVLLAAGPPAGHEWWIWTCVAGVGLGLFGCLFIRHLDRRRAQGGGDTAPHPAPAVPDPAGPPAPRTPAAAEPGEDPVRGPATP
ncbi:DUF2530 domain-containing protein [Sphaerisporangium rufum]|uniref:DUF2530 domain-containing protein n=1 Tax=Sphaerisporangium rufum TaxID=1381558 RepID=UPI001EF2E6F1|nr:DUF2530 domain-containing protein [Sphaerisporangium rufum]